MLPIYDYGSIIFHGYGIHGTKNTEASLQLAFNAWLRFIFNLNKYDHLTNVRTETSIMELYDRREFLICCFLHNVISNQSPTYLQQLLQCSVTNTRSCDDLVIKEARKVRDELSIAHAGAKLWNSVPKKIREIKKHDVFVSRLNEWFLKRKRDASC